MSVLKEFKAFAMKWNVIDLAVWVVIGTAFGKIVSSLVADVIMPIIWVLTGGIDFKWLDYTVGGAAVKYGMFIQSVVDFIIIAFCIFIVVKVMNKALPKKKEDPTGPTELEVLTEIRDLLKKSPKA